MTILSPLKAKCTIFFLSFSDVFCHRIESNYLQDTQFIEASPLSKWFARQMNGKTRNPLQTNDMIQFFRAIFVLLTCELSVYMCALALKRKSYDRIHLVLKWI